MPLQMAELLGAFLETLCYGVSILTCIVLSLALINTRPEGVYLVIAFECVGILRRRDKRQNHSMYLHISAVAMFISITIVRTIVSIAAVRFPKLEGTVAFCNRHHTCNDGLYRRRNCNSVLRRPALVRGHIQDEYIRCRDLYFGRLYRTLSHFHIVQTRPTHVPFVRCIAQLLYGAGTTGSRCCPSCCSSATLVRIMLLQSV